MNKKVQVNYINQKDIDNLDKQFEKWLIAYKALSPVSKATTINALSILLSTLDRYRTSLTLTRDEVVVVMDTMTNKIKEYCYSHNYIKPSGNINIISAFRKLPITRKQAAQLELLNKRIDIFMNEIQSKFKTVSRKLTASVDGGI